jgi:hypothetical protein
MTWFGIDWATDFSHTGLTGLGLGLDNPHEWLTRWPESLAVAMDKQTRLTSFARDWSAAQLNYLSGPV